MILIYEALIHIHPKCISALFRGGVSFNVLQQYNSIQTNSFTILDLQCKERFCKRNV